MNQFKEGDMYTHTGKEFYIKRRTEKSVWVAAGSPFAKQTRKRIMVDRNGVEVVGIDQYRQLTAGRLEI